MKEEHKLTTEQIRAKELRSAWEGMVEPDDYECHMSAIGQARANAILIQDLIVNRPSPKGSSLLFAGAGTGQMFEYISPDFLRDYKLVFSDIRAAFLERLESRLKRSGLKEFHVLVDDIEHPRVGRTDAAAIVLVLEHVNWRQALRQLSARGVGRFYIIVQVNPPDMADAVAPNRVLPPSLARVSPRAKPKLVPTGVLGRFMRELGYRLAFRRDVPVADGKKMAGRVYERRG